MYIEKKTKIYQRRIRKIIGSGFLMGFIAALNLSLYLVYVSDSVAEPKSLEGISNSIPKFLEKNRGLQNLSDDNYNLGYSLLGAAVKVQKSKKPTHLELESVVDLTILMLKVDPSQAAAEYIYEFFKTYNSEIESILKHKSNQESLDFHRALKNYEHELLYGNG